LAAAATAEMTKRQTKFPRDDVNGRVRPQRRTGTPRRGVPTNCGQPLSWRCFAVRKNVRNRRRKLFNAGTRHDDTVTAAVSFLSDAQEPAALIFPELDVEVLALNLQFFRLDDVVHFALRPPSLGTRPLKWKKNPCLLREFLPGWLLGKIAIIDGSEAPSALRRRLLCSLLDLDSAAFFILHS